MCHHADLTATLTRRETYSARGRGLLLFALEQSKCDLSSEVRDVLYRFFADGLCARVCAGHIPHDDLIIHARRQLVAAGAAPDWVLEVRQNVEQRGNPWGGEESDLSVLSGAQAGEDLLVYFGPAARIRRPATVKAFSSLLKAAEVRFSVLRDEGDPGLLLYQLGDSEAATRSANRLAEQIHRSGARRVVTPDADAYRVLKTGFGEVKPLSDQIVQHGSELLAQVVDRLNFRTRTVARVAYHDPCALARFAPCVDAPRVLVRASTDAEPLEIGVWSREFANCSGECGGVPFKYPALSRQAAERRVREARAAGAEVLVTGSPGSATVLEGAGLPVFELSEWLAASLA